MNFAYPAILIALLLVLAIAAYIDRIYSEMGKFLARKYQDNIDSWVEGVEPRLRLGRDSIALSASILRQLSLGAMAFLVGMHVLSGAGPGQSPAWQAVARTVLEIVLLIVFFDRLIPELLFTRTRGLWINRLRLPIRAVLYLISPVTLACSLLLSIAALADPEDSEEPDHPMEAVKALLEAGEEEGILQESDRDLVRSVVEFGDKVVREVMTPRPRMFAVPGSLTLADFTQQIDEHKFSRVPVFAGSLDQITGIVFAHDLLQVLDTEAGNRTVAQLQRPVVFVPETKKVAELLREMQREKQHMRVVIDEYGSVAGLVTIEDLLEAIVGNIADEHDESEADDEPVREKDGSYAVSGNFEVSRLRELFGDARSTADPKHTPDVRPLPDPRSGVTVESPEGFTPGILSIDHGAHSNGTSSQVPAEGELPSALSDDTLIFRLSRDYESTSLGGLVSEIAGHIPLPGEVVEGDGLRFEVLASTDRRIDRVRVSLSPGTEKDSSRESELSDGYED